MQRNTWQREAVRSELRTASGFVAAQSLFGALKAQGSTIGLATVYRTLADLSASGEADVLQQEGENLYRACTPGEHHHHLICRVCGTTVEVDAPPVESWAATVAAQHGFADPSHVVDVFGVCQVCQATGAASGPTV